LETGLEGVLISYSSSHYSISLDDSLLLEAPTLHMFGVQRACHLKAVWAVSYGKSRIGRNTGYNVQLIKKLMLASDFLHLYPYATELELTVSTVFPRRNHASLIKCHFEAQANFYLGTKTI